MRLLFATQVLDRGDAVLGFVPGWVEALAAHVERLRVVALEVGDASGLPDNVDWRVIGRTGSLSRWLRWRRVMREALADGASESGGFDVVLAHMVPRYALLSAGPARRAGARLFLWYTHKGVDARLRRAERVVDAIFTASEESLRLETPKKVVTGHGIDVEHFAARGVQPVRPPRVLSVGRLTRSKDPLTVLAATAILVSRGHDLRLDWVGKEKTLNSTVISSVPTIRGLARAMRQPSSMLAPMRQPPSRRGGGPAGRVELHGPVPWSRVPPLYQRATVLVNASLTGSVDKVVLEAMACERPVLTCNESFAPLFAELGADAERLRFAPGDADELATKLEALLLLSPAQRAALGSRLRAIVVRDHEVSRLCERLVREMSARAGRGGRA